MATKIAMQPWREAEFTFRAEQPHQEPYCGVDMWADFTHSSGMVLRRPAFYDGGGFWKIRFCSPFNFGEWNFTTFSNTEDIGLKGQHGSIPCVQAYNQKHKFYSHGFWHIPPGKRNLVYADGTPCLLAADTAWALPWRATTEQCKVYAEDRQKKGFNAALLMSVQPDMRAKGPQNRHEDHGFDIGFFDLPKGHITSINIEYFQYLDKLIEILVKHEIVPVYSPLFHGYGWKGLDVIGPVVPESEYARYCRYLVARYGARPAMYLVGADGHGNYESIRIGGEEIEAWDCYKQPTGLHYCPHSENRAWQDQPWLDFQWCQTGHLGEHVQERLVDMWRNTPIKAIANGEPTYENIAWPGNAAGWWQGHEAIRNLCAGGTIGVVYGAGGLWPWKLHKDEPVCAEWCDTKGAGWREALDFEGSNYVGLLSKIFEGLPFAEMEPNWWFTCGLRGLAVPGQFFLVYSPEGAGFPVISDKVPLPYRVIDPKTGNVLKTGKLSKENITVPMPRDGQPKIVIFCNQFEI